ncbi:hypothetical protein K2173_004267 [Erythroxylum novogranatense]|uniref:Fe2OG dioxygenase domain-containing protein n=1 Tax=Erythroxylum novogranatense TaxID=1862640 RepID=A0AAV8U2C1_9ROSI|nr:hypothetical protein K2173_004267 [Erythroxylum novogranatense]
MGSETTDNLPIIEFSTLDIKAGTPEWNSVKSQVRKAVEEYGCFEALFEEFPLQPPPEAIVNALKELFDLPLETKMREVSQKPLHGYCGQWPEVPLYESMGFEEPISMHMVEKVTNILWPEGNPSFSKTIHSFSKKLSELDHMIRRMVAESMGLEKYLEDLNNSKSYLLRVNKYEGPLTSEKMVGLMAHTDKGLVTVLYQFQVDGFEVQTQEGHWITANPSPSSFLVVTGEALRTWTSGRVHAVCHRVMMSGNRTRYAAGLFAVAKTGCVITAPEEQAGK